MGYLLELSKEKGFKEMMTIAQPRWINFPSHTTFARDCLKVYMEEKNKLKIVLKGQRICLTIDTWTSVKNLNYMSYSGKKISDFSADFSPKNRFSVSLEKKNARKF